MVGATGKVCSEVRAGPGPVGPGGPGWGEKKGRVGVAGGGGGSEGRRAAAVCGGG